MYAALQTMVIPCKRVHPGDFVNSFRRIVSVVSHLISKSISANFDRFRDGVLDSFNGFVPSDTMESVGGKPIEKAVEGGERFSLPSGSVGHAGDLGEGFLS